MRQPTSAPGPADERPWAPLALALFAVAAAYSAAPLGGFVWDDVTLILEQRIVRELQPLSSYFDRMFFGGPAGAPTRAFYRPLVVLSFALDWRIWDGSPLGFHVTNVLLHLGCVGLVFGVARKWGARPRDAALAAALFGLLPRLSEAVAWISGRTDLLASIFVLSALWIHRPETGRRWITAALLLLGLLSKEVAIAGVASIAILEIHGGRREGEGAAALAERLLPLAAATSAYAALRWIAQASAKAPSLAPELSWSRRLGVAVEAIGSYSWMAIDPFRPRTQIGSVWVPDAGLIALGAGVLAVSALLAWRFRRSRIPDPVLVGLVLALVSLGLVLHLLPVALQVVAADRFLYLPAAAVAMAGAAATSRLSGRVARVAPLVGMVLAPALAATTYLRAADWSDEISLWSAAVGNAPEGNSLPFVQLGLALTRTGKPELSLPHLERAAEIDDRLFRERGVGDGHGSGSREALALAFVSMGRIDEALPIYAALADARRNEPVHRYNFAVVLAMALDFDGARRELATVLERFPDYDVAATYRERLAGIESRWRSLPAPSPDEAPEVAIVRARLLLELERARDAVAIWRRIADDPAVAASHRREAIESIEALKR